jgi:hypothetical protein
MNQYSARIKLFDYFLLFSFLFTQFGCSSSYQFQYIGDEYKSRKESTVSVLVLPFIQKLLNPAQSEYLIDKKTVERKTLTAKETELFDNYIPQILSENTYVKINHPDNQLSLKELKFIHRIEITESGEKLDLFLPNFEGNAAKKESADYTMIFSDLYFIKDYIEKSPTLGSGTQGSYSMKAGLDYLLWDNKKNKIAGYGKLTNSLKLIEVPTKENYLDVFEKFAISIIKQSPFSPKKIYF